MESPTFSFNGDFNINPGSWWRSAGLLDTKSSDKMSSICSGNSFQNRPKEFSHQKKSRKKNNTLDPLIFQMEEFLDAPTHTNLKKLYHIISQKSNNENNYKNKCNRISHTFTMKLLDVLAEQIVLHFDGNSDMKQHSMKQKQQQQQQEEEEEEEEEETSTCELYLKVFYWFLKDICIGYPSNSMGKFLLWLMTSLISSCLHYTTSSSSSNSSNSSNISNSSNSNNSRGDDDDDDDEKKKKKKEKNFFKLSLQLFNQSVKFNNAGIRLYVKENFKKIKEFYRALTILLNRTEDSSFLIYSMSILARLVLNHTDDDDEKEEEEEEEKQKQKKKKKKF
jgi:hypothetical protein